MTVGERFDAAAGAYRRFLGAWVDAMRRGALWVVLLAVLVTVGAAAFTVTHLKINTDTTDMLSPDLPFRRLSTAMHKAFPQSSDTLLVVIDGANADLADDAATRMAAYLRKYPKVFGSLYDPADDPFFRRNGLLYLSADQLSSLSDQLAESQPFVGALWHDPSLRGLLKMLDLAIGETLKAGGKAPIDIAPFLDRMASVTLAHSAGRPGTLSWQSLMGGDANALGGRRRFLLLKPKLDYGSLQPAGTAIASVRQAARDLHLDAAHGVRVRMTGELALSQDELRTVQQGMGLAGALSMVLVIGLMLIGVKSLRMTGVMLATLIMGLVWTAGFAVAAVGALNLISVAFAVLFIGLSVDFGIHFVLRYQEERRGGAGQADALRRTAENNGGALTLCAVAAAIGFYAFLPTAYIGLAELGLIAGSGMFIALFANLTVLPALVTLLPWHPRQRNAQPENHAARPRRRRHGLHLSHRFSREVIVVAAVIGLAAAALVPFARFDFDPLNLRNPNTESMRTLIDLMDNPRTGPYSISVLAPNLDAAKALAARLSKLDAVKQTETLTDYIPTDQEDKLAIISDMALFLSPALAQRDPPPPPSEADLLSLLEKVRTGLDRLANTAANEKLAGAAARLRDALAGLGDPPSAAALTDLGRRLLSTLPGRLRELRESLNAGPVTLATLPSDLRSRWLAADGRSLVKAYPKADLRNTAALRHFVKEVRSVAPDATGAPVIIMEAGKAVITAFIEAGAIAVAAISLLLVVLLRRLSDILMVFAPLFLAAVLTVGATVVSGMAFNFANVIVLPLLFGLGVASGIHLVLREREEHDVAMLLETSTPRAVVFSALTTIGSFGSIALSSHPGTASMGILLTIAISLTLVCTLGVLPALMTLRRGKSRDRSAAS